MRLRERFEARQAATPAQADTAPMGTGAPNRHGMPRLPPGQHEVTNWPVLDLGTKPVVSKDVWRLELSGACAHPQELDWSTFMALPIVEDTSDFHCVTTWSRYDMRWRGVRFADLAALAGVHDDAEHVLCHAYDHYTTNVPLVEALKGDVLLAFEVDGQPLPREHGGPVRMITPQLYAWKGAKWIRKIEFRVHDRPGFWEERGYSNSAHPWREDRYS
ncbi:MAG: sulfite oxidase-like oxidoreductase [Myxococcales bacterium]|nr:sulfite oxidase-like oxidoreductase [Myxococcales bacterium]